MDKDFESDHTLTIKDSSILTERQNQILNLILGGDSKTEEIAKKLGLAKRTVKNYIYGNTPGPSGHTKESLGIFGNIEEKFGQRPYSQTEMIKMLVENDVVEQSPK